MSLLLRYAKWGERFDPETISIKQALRVNTLKVSDEKIFVKQFIKRGVSLTPIPFLPHAYWFESSFPLASTPQYLSGEIYIQETASQIPVIELLHEKETSDKLILDMCSAPGSKTTQLSQLAPNSTIIALDISTPRLTALQYNLERLFCSNVLVYKKDALYAQDLGLTFDFILLDAPCSGNFTLEKNFFSKRTLSDVKTKPKQQLALLSQAYQLLNKGGVLVYSTCSLEPEENELCINAFLSLYDDISLVPLITPIGDEGFTSILSKELSPSVALTKRLWPHKTNTQGFFIAKMVKK
jgi:tRNA (cytosine40_48-C5)-methyltransferase